MITRLRFIDYFSFTGFAIVLAVCGFGAATFFEKPTLHELQREHDAYRVCMQSAGRLGCNMQPADFVRFYQIEDQIRVMSEDL